MLVSDRITGAVVSALGAASYIFGSQLPPVPGQQVGPSAFPMVVGVGLVICGGLIVAGVGRHFEEVAEGDLASHSAPEALEEVHGWKAWLALLPPALLAFYALVSERLGFLPTTAFMILVASFAFGAKARLAVPLAVIAPLVIGTIFSKLLRVPLPAGLLPLPW